MELELDLAPDDAARLPRLALLAPMKSGRARARPVRIVWHDSPDHALAADGLALAEQRPFWRLERLAMQRLGAPAEVVVTDRTTAALGHALPDPRVPLVAFEGRAQTLTLGGEQGAIVLTLLNGVVRTLASEHRISRVRLEGDAAAVQSLATAITGELRLSVACTSLAGEALAVVTGVPPAQSTGPAELPPGLGTAAAFAHVADHLGGVILHFAPAAASGRDGPEPVHQMRVAVRRLRSAIKVFGRALHCPTVEAADAGLKALAARLAPTRDWDVFLTETAVAITNAFPDEKRLQRLLAAAERRRRGYHEALRAYLGGSEFRGLGIALACLAASQDWHAELDEAQQGELAVPLDDFAARELNRRLKRLVQVDGHLAGLEPPALHAIRLRAKRLRYAAEIFSLLYPAKASSRYLRRLSKLQDRLGTLNDGAVAASLLAELGESGGGHAFAIGLVLGFLGANSVRVRARIEQSWDRFSRSAAFWE
jgi:CHAD domain-containing protein